MKLFRSYDSPTLFSRAIMAMSDLLLPLAIPRQPSPRLPLDPADTQRLLLLRLDGIGDNVCSWPALKMLREQLPTTHISLAVGPWVAALYNECPWVNEIIEWDSGLFGFFRGQGVNGLAADIARCRQLRQTHFNAGIDLRGDLLSIALLSMIAPSTRVGDISRGGQRLLTDPLTIQSGHETVRTCETVCLTLGIPATPTVQPKDWPRPQAHGQALRRLREAGWDETLPTVALCPLALWPWKQWPQERFKELANQLKNEFGLQALWFLENHDQASAYTSNDPVFCGPLDEVAAALSLCRLAVANDSGLMHLAIAAGCKTVQLFGPGDAKRFGHHLAATILLHDTSCQYNPCTRSGNCKNGAAEWCLGKIRVEDVTRACEQLLAKN